MSWPGFIWPENIFWFGLSLFTWVYLTPELAAMETFELWWVGLIYARNLTFIVLLFGGMHYFLYMRQSQGDKLRFTTKPKKKHCVLGNVRKESMYSIKGKFAPALPSGMLHVLSVVPGGDGKRRR